MTPSLRDELLARIMQLEGYEDMTKWKVERWRRAGLLQTMPDSDFDTLRAKFLHYVDTGEYTPYYPTKGD